MKTKIIGLGIVVVIAIAAVFFQLHPIHKPVVTLKGFVGGEKTGLLDDSDFKHILASKYGLALDYSKAGSIEMVKSDQGGNDFLFPSSETALEIYKAAKGRQWVKSANVFNSPLVIYTWDDVAEAFIKARIVYQKDAVYYVDLPKLTDWAVKNKKWSEVGLDLYGTIQIMATDPTKSNSGNMFAGLLANIFYGRVVDPQNVPAVIPKLQQFFGKLGYLESSSSDLFEQYLRTGMGAKPMIVGYENQMIEFAHDNPDIWQGVKNKVRILYPVPTVWSAHPLIALDSQANGLIAALQDPEIQKIAWEKHGFRTGLLGAKNDLKLIRGMSVPAEISKVIPLPNAEVMERIIAGLQD
jgi:hypothetical protein